MDRISFSCAGCKAKLGVDSALRGKTITCPKCKQKTQVPAFEVVDELPPPPPAPVELLRFACMRCDAKLRVSPELGGQSITCPKCRESTLVPDPKLGSYTLDDKANSTAAAPVEERPLAEWWPDTSKLNLPFSWQTPLATAREHAENRRWTKALGILNELFQKGLSSKSKVGTHVLRKPLSFCLGRWAVRELDRLEEEGEKLSKPLRKVLKQAAVLHPAFAQFSQHACALCAEKLNSRSRTPLRTVAGTAFLCCAEPTDADEELIQTVDKINKKLTVGLSLDGDNVEIAAALTRIPDWYRALDLNPQVSESPVDDKLAGWGKITAAGDRGNRGGGGGGGGGGVVVAGDGGAAGEVAGQMASDFISGLLFG